MMKFFIFLITFLICGNNYIKAFLFMNANLDSVEMAFFYGDNLSDVNSYKLDDMQRIVNSHQFHPEIKTVLYIHGYNESLESENIQTVVSAYIYRNDHNIIVLDWSELAKSNYLITVFLHTNRIGEYVGETLLTHFENGYIDIKKFHIVGFSLGAHIGGVIGAHIQRNSNRKLILPRITGLDPGFPGYYIKPYPTHLSRDQAAFVDIVHTDAAKAGSPVSSGTVDFWPNGGSRYQPGCLNISNPTDSCSHQRSWRIWAESVENKNPRKFVAIKADSWDNYVKGKYSKPTQMIQIGIQTPTNQRNFGNYFLKTNWRSPYAQGKNQFFKRKRFYMQST